MAKIIPAILAKNEEEYIKKLRLSENVSDLIQVDLVDGKFANNLTIAPQVVVDNPTRSYLEVQIMSVTVGGFVKQLLGCKFISRIIIPVETREDIYEIIYQIKKSGKMAGISLNPKTPPTFAAKYFRDADLILLLSVNPGFSGQKLQESVFEKIRFIKSVNPECPIEVDGGISFENASKLAKSKVNFLAANSVLFEAEDFFLAYEKLAKVASVF